MFCKGCKPYCACTLFALYIPVVSAEWWVGGSFLPASLLALFLFTHPPTTAQNQHKDLHFWPHPQPWLGSRISTELKMRKRVLQCDPGFHLSAMSVFAVMFILIFPRHVRRSIRFDFLFIRSSAVRRFYLRRFVRVIVCVGGLR